MILCKGLGAPVGSVLLSDEKLIRKGKRVRKVLGGGMRQAGYLAAAGIYALDNHIPMLKNDHHRARQLAKVISDLPFTDHVMNVETNIIITKLHEKIDVGKFLHKLSEEGVKAVAFGPQRIRMVTHLNIDDDKLDYTCKILKSIKVD